jgi:hypothetical protein
MSNTATTKRSKPGQPQNDQATEQPPASPPLAPVPIPPVPPSPPSPQFAPNWLPPKIAAEWTSQILTITLEVKAYHPFGDERPDTKANEILQREVIPQLRKAAEDFAGSATDAKEFGRLNELKRVLSGNLELAKTNAHIAGERARLYLNGRDPDLLTPPGMSEAEASAAEMEKEAGHKAEASRLQTSLEIVENQLRGATPRLFGHQQQFVRDELQKLKAAAAEELAKLAREATETIIKTAPERVIALHWLTSHNNESFVDQVLTIPRPH